MSEFTGKGIKVRCVDCTHLDGNICRGKNKTPKVAPKKRRTCAVYNFRGEYKNRKTAKSVYIPHMDKKTRKLIRRMLDAGISPVGEKPLVVPATTATSAVIKTPSEVEADNSSLYVPQSSINPETSLIWTPNGVKEEDNETNSRS